MPETTIEYIPNSKPDLDPDGYGLLGMYRVAFDDGVKVMLPHTGWKGTISADPLDPEVVEQRAIIEASAEQARQDFLNAEGTSS